MAAMRKFEVTSNCCNQAHIQGGAIGCTAPTINLAARTRNLQNIKDKHADQPAKKKTCDTLPHPRVASAEPPSLEKTETRSCT